MLKLPKLDDDALRALVRDVPDFPKPGILFKDITPLVGDAHGLATTIERLADTLPRKGSELPSALVAIESRGFLFGSALAVRLGLPIIPVRKPGKLPWKKSRVEYALEYGTDALEMHSDALDRARSVVVIDDVLATGGTAAATCRLVEQHNVDVIGCSFVIELGFLGGREKLRDREVASVLKY
jgi:adenine phosphoribosyltransferase